MASYFGRTTFLISKHHCEKVFSTLKQTTPLINQIKELLDRVYGPDHETHYSRDSYPMLSPF